MNCTIRKRLAADRAVVLDTVKLGMKEAKNTRHNPLHSETMHRDAPRANRA